MKLLKYTALATLLLMGAVEAQTICHITATNVRASPNGPIIGWFDYETPVQVLNTAPPWLYVTSPYGDGWVWGRYVDPICVPEPCCIPCPTCGMVASNHHDNGYHHPHPHYNHHEKGEYQAPASVPEAPAPAPEAPMPDNQHTEVPVAPPSSCYSTDAGCAH